MPSSSTKFSRLLIRCAIDKGPYSTTFSIVAFNKKLTCRHDQRVHASTSLFELHTGTLRTTPPSGILDPFSTLSRGSDSVSFTWHHLPKNGQEKRADRYDHLWITIRNKKFYLKKMWGRWDENGGGMCRCDLYQFISLLINSLEVPFSVCARVCMCVWKLCIWFASDFFFFDK